MRGAKFLNCTAKRRQKNRTVQTVRSVVSFSWGASAGLPPLRGPRCTALVARLLLCRIRRAGEHAVSASPLRCAASAGPESMPFPPPLSVAPHPPGRRACRFRLPSPLRRIRRAGEHAGSASPLRFPSPLRRPVALFPLSPRCAPPVGLEITPLPCAIPPPLGCSLRVPPPCRAAGFIAWRPAPDRSAGPRCRAPCGRCLPRSPTR